MVPTTADAQTSEVVSAPDVSKIEAPTPPVATPDRVSTPTPLEEFTTITPEMVAERQALRERQNNQGQIGQDIYSGLAGLATRGQATIQAEEEAGIGRLSTELTDVENEIAQKSLAFRRERERIMAAGGNAAQVNALLADVSRKQNSELADLEVIRSARSNSLTNAQNLVNRQIELEFGDKIAQVNALKFIYDENKEMLTKEEDRLFQQTIKREERAFQVAADEFKTVQQEKNKYLTNAAQAGADNNTLKAIQSAQSLDELYAMEGIAEFAMSKAEKLSVALQQQNLVLGQENLIDIREGRQARREERQAKVEAEAARLAAIESGQIQPEQAELIDELDKQFRSEPIVKEYNVAVAKKAGVDAVINSGVQGVEDLALVYEFMKSIDPTSVVRESEFDTAAGAGNIFQGQFAKFNGYFREGGGMLPENVRQSFRASIEQSFAQKESQYYNVKDQFGEKVNRRLGIDNGSQYLTQYDAASSLQVDDDGNIVIPGRQSNEDFFGANQ